MTEASNTVNPQDSETEKLQDSNAEIQQEVKPPEDKRIARCIVSFVLSEGNSYSNEMRIPIRNLTNFSNQISDAILKDNKEGLLCLNGSVKSPYDSVQIVAKHVIMHQITVLEIYEDKEEEKA